MDWVETTGKSIEEATDRALAHLGVHKDDAEIEVIEEPKAGLFGRVRGEARIRVRVRPSGPRPKRARSSSDRGSRGARAEKTRPATKATKAEKPTGTTKLAEEKKSRQPRKADEAKPKKNHEARGPVTKKEEPMGETIPLAEQGRLAQEFLKGLLASMDITADISVKEIDEETIEVAVDKNPPSDLGVLVGPRGMTLQALQEVTRTFVQTKSPGRINRILLDVAQYRERRVAALARFAEQVAAEVVQTGEERALEPMSAADRKAIHDALTSSNEVVTRSEGEEPRRFVVVAPA
jgi:spoIIIJ-associated protein